MTVLHIFSGDLWAGAERMIFNLLKGLKDYPNIKIIALSLNQGTLSDKLQGIGIETIVISEDTNSFLQLFLKAFHHLKARHLDIIHSHRYKENLLAYLLSQSMGVKRLVTTLHGLSEPLVNRDHTNTSIGLKARMDHFILKHAFSRVVAVSQDIKNVLERQHGFAKTKVEVISNGIEIPQLANLANPKTDRLPTHHFHIGTVGRMVPIKDFDLFLEVAAAITREVSSTHFSILGDGPLKERLIRKTKDLKIERSVEFKSPLMDPFPYYESLDLYLNTSHHEGFPLSILEAMVCGRPVVAPRVGGVPEIITHGEQGLLAETRSPKEFADLCLKLIRDKDLRIAMGTNSSKRISSSFSNLRMATRYNELYQAL